MNPQPTSTPSTTSEAHAKHTPGPWRFEMENSYYKIYENKHDIRITTLNQEVTEDKANAQLIAAAPELLEACKRAAFVLFVSKDLGAHPSSDDLNGALSLLHSAIDKVEAKK